MENYLLEATKYTPLISFSASQNQLEISGESYPENTIKFFLPCFNWLKEYLDLVEGETIRLKMDLSYFNSSSSKVFMDIFDLLDAAGKENEIIINWYYDPEDEDSLEYGEDFKEDLKTVMFNLIEK